MTPRSLAALFALIASHAATAQVWVEVKGDVPRRGDAVYDVARQRGVAYADDRTWEWDGQAWVERPSANRPGAGTWDGFDWQQLQTTGQPPQPPSLGGFALAYDERRSVAVLALGGSRADVWELNGTTWTSRGRAASGPGTVAMHYDVGRQRIAAIGEGCGGDHWEWDGTGWTLRANGYNCGA